jgi:Protein of unknown function (DUF1552)
MAGTTSTIISRRKVLRGMLASGVAVSVPLPRLGAMLNGNGTAYAAGGALPVRFGTWFFGNGIIPSRWNPARTGTGNDWTLSEQLEPLLEVKPWISVVTGLNMKSADIAAHQSHPIQALTGAQTGPGIVQLPTIDQVIGAITNTGATYPNGLHVGICSTNGATGQGLNLSYIKSAAPNPPQLSPAMFFAQLVKYAMPAAGGPAKAPDPELLRRRMVLDAIGEESKTLRARLGVEDQRRLDLHLSGLHQLQGQIMAMEAPKAVGTLADPDKVYANRGADGAITRQRCQAFSDMLVFALAGDLTRVFTFLFTSPACHGQYTEIGLAATSLHAAYGHRGGPGGVLACTESFNKGIRFSMSCLSDLLVRMRNTPDGAGNLLDNSAIYTTSCCSEAPTHSGNDFPLLISGKAGGKLKGDMHVRMVGDNVSKVPYTLLTAFGGTANSYGLGDSMTQGTISELLA